MSLPALPMAEVFTHSSFQNTSGSVKLDGEGLRTSSFKSPYINLGLEPPPHSSLIASPYINQVQPDSV